MKDLRQFDRWRLNTPDDPQGRNDPEVAAISGAFGFRLTEDGPGIICIASNGGGWDHVSVSVQDRCPTWEEMDRIKRIFFKPGETAMQLHVAESEHISHHPYTLHIWRPHGTKRAIPLPPKEFV